MSNTEKHTPGPWKVHRGNDYLVVLRPDDTTDTGIHVPFGDDADAKLIARAPALLAQNKRMREALGYLEISTRPDGQWADRPVNEFVRAALNEKE